MRSLPILLILSLVTLAVAGCIGETETRSPDETEAPDLPAPGPQVRQESGLIDI